MKPVNLFLWGILILAIGVVCTAMITHRTMSDWQIEDYEMRSHNLEALESNLSAYFHSEYQHIANIISALTSTTRKCPFKISQRLIN